MKVVFVEPPKEFWFVMGEYLPPSTAIIQLATYLEKKRPGDDITVIDCQAESLDWKGLEKTLEVEEPDVVAVSSLATCNAYTVVRALEVAKRVAPDSLTVTGGQHFSALAESSIKQYSVIDAIIRGEGEETLVASAPEILASYGKNISPGQAHKAVKLLKENDIFAQATLIIGNRQDTHESIERLRKFVDNLDPDLTIYMILTPFPGTELYDEAYARGWIEDWNWANYDMVHAVMPTETLTRKEVQQELYECYRAFYGRFSRRIRGIFSSNKLKRKTYRYLASQSLLRQLQGLI